MLLCGDGEYSISTTRVLRSKCYGSALEAVWSADGNGDYAVISGIIHARAAEVENCYARSFDVVRKEIAGEWQAMLLRKK